MVYLLENFKNSTINQPKKKQEIILSLKENLFQIVKKTKHPLTILFLSKKMLLFLIILLVTKIII